MTLRDTVYMIYGSQRAVIAGDGSFVDLMLEQEAKCEEIVRNAEPSDLDHFFSLLFDNTLYGSEQIINFDEHWAIEVLSWLQEWDEIHPGIVYEKIVSLVRDPNQWKPLLSTFRGAIRIFKDGSDFIKLYWLEAVVTEATKSNSLDKELVELIEDCINSYLQNNSTRALTGDEVEQIAQFRSKLARG